MKAVVLAYHNIGCAGVKALLDHGFTIQAIFTHKDDPGENVWFDSVEQLAAEHDIPVFAPGNINHPLWVERIREFSPDILFSFYYRAMVGKDILGIPKNGCFNLHGSLLPKYRGRCPVNWVLVNGEKETGVTLHRMTPQPDNGDIISRQRIAISSQDTALTLHKKLTTAAERLLSEALPALLAGNFSGTVQDQALASYFGGRKPADGEIDWQESSERIYNLVRAVTRPYPGAFSYLGDQKVLFWSVSLGEDYPDQQPGTIISTNPLIISCNQGSVRVHAGQTENGLFMSGNQLVDELGLAAGMRLGKKRSQSFEQKRKKHVLILGADGFIGNHLSERLLDSGHYEVHAMDLSSNSIGRLLGTPGFHFSEGDISIHREWIEYHVRKCDIILPPCRHCHPRRIRAQSAPGF